MLDQGCVLDITHAIGDVDTSVIWELMYRAPASPEPLLKDCTTRRFDYSESRFKAVAWLGNGAKSI